MTLKDRLVQSEQTFNNLNARRSELLKEADQLETELHKLMGEHRLLTELIKEDAAQPSVEVVNEGKKAEE